jgi:hypothetical protein
MCGVHEKEKSSENKKATRIHGSEDCIATRFSFTTSINVSCSFRRLFFLHPDQPLLHLRGT